MDAFIDFFDPLPIAVLFGVLIVGGLALIFGLEALVHRRMRSETRERVSGSMYPADDHHRGPDATCLARLGTVSEPACSTPVSRVAGI